MDTQENLSSQHASRSLYLIILFYSWHVAYDIGFMYFWQHFFMNFVDLHEICENICLSSRKRTVHLLIMASSCCNNIFRGSTADFFVRFYDWTFQCSSKKRWIGFNTNKCDFIFYLRCLGLLACFTYHFNMCLPIRLNFIKIFRQKITVIILKKYSLTQMKKFNKKTFKKVLGTV